MAGIVGIDCGLGHCFPDGAWRVKKGFKGFVGVPVRVGKF